MMMPSIFGENLLDNFMEGFAFPDMDKILYGNHGRNLMKTDVKDGYLTVNAAKSMNRDEKNEAGSYIRRERYAGSMSRSFYVGDHVTEQDVHPKYENGILTFHIPKAQPKAVEDKGHYISIEG